MDLSSARTSLLSTIVYKSFSTCRGREEAGTARRREAAQPQEPSKWWKGAVGEEEKRLLYKT